VQTVLGSTFCGERLLVASSGNATDEGWVEYIKKQAAPEPDDVFKVRESVGGGEAVTRSHRL
jgi:hypothetical protein